MELGSHDRAYWVGVLIAEGIWTEDRMPHGAPVGEWEYNSQMDWYYRGDYAEQLEIGHIAGEDMPWELLPEGREWIPTGGVTVHRYMGT